MRIKTIFSIAIICMFVFSCGETTNEKSEEKVRGEKTEAAMPDFNKLIGRWQRPDGGYVIEVRNISGDGNADASYYNPNPINVVESRAFEREDNIGLFIKMDDRGYPGSTYDLVYDSESNSLSGIYYQATMKQEFSVLFQKIE